MTAAVIDLIDINRHQGFARYITVTVVEPRRRQPHGTVGNQRSALVIQRLGGRDVHDATTVEQTISVVQASTVGVKRGCADRTFGVAQGVLNLQCQALVTDQLTAAVIQVASCQAEGLLAGHFATLVIDISQVFQHQQRAIDQAAHVAQLALIEVQIELGIAEQFTALLIQAGEGGGQVFAAGDTSAVVHLGGCQVQAISACDAAIVVQRAGGQGQRTTAVEQAFGAVVQARAGERQGGIGLHDAALVGDSTAGSKGERTCRRDGTRVVVERRAGHLQGAFAADFAQLVIQPTIQFSAGNGDQRHAQRLLARESALAVIQARAVEAVVPGENQSLGLVDHMRHGQVQCGTGDQFSRAVIQALRLEVDAALAGNLTRTVINGVDRQFQRFCGAYQAALAIVQGGPAKAQLILGNQFTALLGQYADSCLQICLAGDAASRVFYSVGRQAQGPHGTDQALLVAQLLPGEAQGRLAAERTVLVVQLTHIELKVLLGKDHACAVVDFRTVHRQQVLPGQPPFAVIQMTGTQFHRAFGQHLPFGLIVQ